MLRVISLILAFGSIKRRKVESAAKTARCGQLFHSKRFKMCTRCPKQQDTANFFIRNDSKCARDVQNSKIRPTFSSELSQNVHENTTRRGQLFHFKNWQVCFMAKHFKQSDLVGRGRLRIERRKVESAAKTARYGQLFHSKWVKMSIRSACFAGL